MLCVRVCDKSVIRRTRGCINIIQYIVKNIVYRLLYTNDCRSRSTPLLFMRVLQPLCAYATRATTRGVSSHLFRFAGLVNHNTRVPDTRCSARLKCDENAQRAENPLNNCLCSIVIMRRASRLELRAQQQIDHCVAARQRRTMRSTTRVCDHRASASSRCLRCGAVAMSQRRRVVVGRRRRLMCVGFCDVRHKHVFAGTCAR